MYRSQSTPTELPLGCGGTGRGQCINIIIIIRTKKHTDQKYICGNRIRPMSINGFAFNCVNRFLSPS